MFFKKLWRPQGRYGGDKLGVGLLLLSLCLMLTSRFGHIFWMGILAYIPLVWFVFRFLSSNLPKRYAELNAFMKVYGPVERFFAGIPAYIKDAPKRKKERQENCHFKCPSCGQKLRVPRGRGKIEITCPKCRHVFYKNT